MQICVSGIGVVSSIGIGVEANLASLASQKDGMGSIAYFDSAHKLPVSEVKASNQELRHMLSLSERKTYSRTALLGMLAAKEALVDANVDLSRYRVGLVSATSVGGMDLTVDFYREFSQNPSGGRLRNIASHDCYDSTQRIAEYCGITHFSTTISTACSSAANAVMLGSRLIKHGYLDCVLVGGTDALCKFTLNGFNSLMILDSQRCRPFDDSRSGLNLGEGAGYIVLQRADTILHEPYCMLAGYANANDAFHQTASSADGDGAYLAMKQALSMSGLHPEDISYINVHGTGTPNNDASEGAALRRIFGDAVPSFSSTKPYTGHTLAAAGGIEAVFSVLSIAKGLIYPNLNFKTPMEGSGLIPETTYREGEAINAVMSNSFGFGGNNSSLIFTKRDGVIHK
jgi:3-oxoacyl-(acyl-carrier-protein) synthase